MFRFEWILTSYPTIRWLNRQLDRRFTTGGKVVLGASLFFMAGSSHLDSPVYLLLAATLTLLFIALVLSVYYRPELACEFRVPFFAVVNENTSFDLTVANRGSKSAHDLEFYLHNYGHSLTSSVLESSPACLKLLPPDKKACVTIEMKPTERGVYGIPEVFCKTAFPFYLIHSKTSFANAGKVAVVPEFQSLKTRDLFNDLSSSFFGEQNRSRSLRDQEFVGSREYVPGISNRRWDYSAWARLNIPHVRQYEDEGHKHAVVVFDTAQRIPNTEEFESAISMVLSVVDCLHQNRISIEGFVVDDCCTDFANMSVVNQWHETCFQMATVKPRVRSSSTELMIPNTWKDHIAIVVAIYKNDRVQKLQEDLLSSGCLSTLFVVGSGLGLSGAGPVDVGKRSAEEVSF